MMTLVSGQCHGVVLVTRDDTSVMSHKATIMTGSLFSLTPLSLQSVTGGELTAAYPILTQDDTIPLTSSSPHPSVSSIYSS